MFGTKVRDQIEDAVQLQVAHNRLLRQELQNRRKKYVAGKEAEISKPENIAVAFATGFVAKTPVQDCTCDASHGQDDHQNAGKGDSGTSQTSRSVLTALLGSVAMSVARTRLTQAADGWLDQVLGMGPLAPTDGAQESATERADKDKGEAGVPLS